MKNNLYIFSTSTKKKEIFKPLHKDKLLMYSCGITVYDHLHIGHARQAIVFDVIRNYFEYLGYKVTYARNYTDIDDKIIQKAQENGKTFDQISLQFINESKILLKKLHIRPATFEPKVSDHISQIIDFISQLIEKKFAYIRCGEVFFSVKRFKEYGKLSHQQLDKLVSSEGSINKKDPLDFMLWKSAKVNEPFWESPWGKGRPGWHIECSTLVKEYLGDTIDIHGGGIDLIFPHHENEIAQSESRSGKKFASYWIHNGLVKVNGNKMSKSLNNFVTVKDSLAKYHPEVIRFFVLSHHYAKTINFSNDLLKEAEERVRYVYYTLLSVDNYLIQNKIILKSKKTKNLYKKNINLLEIFLKNMNNDFNTVGFLADFSKILTNINNLIENGETENNELATTLYQFKKEMVKVCQILGIFCEKPSYFISEFKNTYLKRSGISLSFIEEEIVKRTKARAKKEFKKADSIRNDLLKNNITLQDREDGTVWDVVID